MKKSLLWVASIALVSLVFWWLVNAELATRDVFSHWEALPWAYSRILQEYDSSWWYSEFDTLACSWEDENSITISTPIMWDQYVVEVPEYRIIVSPYRMSELKDNRSIDTSEVIVKDVRRTAGSETVDFTLSSEDGLELDKAYYGFIIPINDYDEIGNPTQETCFQLSSNMCMWWEACDALELVLNPVEEEDPVAVVDDNEHGASCSSMNLANISHTISADNVITLRWSALPDGDSVQVGIFDPDEEVYRPLGSVKMSDEKFSYRMQWNGEHNFMITNGCRPEVYYKVDASIKTPEPTIPATPATGPAENILIIAIAAIVIYGLYNVLFRKNSN